MTTSAAASTQPSLGSRAEPWLFGLLVFALAAALARPVFYKTDGPDLLFMLHAGDLHHPWNVAYLPLLELFRHALAAVGLQPALLLLGQLFSALGAAVAIAGFRTGLRRLQTPVATARLATLLLALSPGTLLFARVVEFHAPLLGAVGLAFWWTTVQVARPSWWGMALLGGCTHVAFLLHSSALFLPAWLLPFFLARRWSLGQRRRDLQFVLLAGGVHTAAFVLLPKVFPGAYGLFGDLQAAFTKEAATGRPQSLDWLPTIVRQEWLQPLLPLSLLPLLALRRRGLWLELLALLLGMAPFLYICVRQLVHEPEYGAYMLPLLLPAALLSAQVLSLRWGLLALAVSVPLAMYSPIVALMHADQQRYAAWATSVRAGAGGQPFYLLVGSHDEMAMAIATLQPGEFLWVRPQAALPRERYTPAVADATSNGLAAMIAGGRVLLATDQMIASLRDPVAMMRAEKAAAAMPTAAMAGPLFLQVLEQHYEFVPLAAAAATAVLFRLQPRR